MEETWHQLVAGLSELEVKSRETGVELAFEPEPGMFIEDLASFRELQDRFASRALKLTIDLGHLECTEERPLDRWLREFADR